MAADKAASLLLEQTDDLDAALILVRPSEAGAIRPVVENAEYDVITDLADEAQGACDRAVEHFRAERHGRLTRGTAIKNIRCPMTDADGPTFP
jgi:hypothetical protein